MALKDLLDHGDKSLKMELKRSEETGEPIVPEDHWFSLIRRYVRDTVVFYVYGSDVLSRQQVSS